MRQRWAGIVTYSMTTTLARRSQPPDPTINLAIAPILKTPHSAPTPLHHHHRAMCRLTLTQTLTQTQTQTQTQTKPKPKP